MCMTDGAEGVSSPVRAFLGPLHNNNSTLACSTLPRLAAECIYIASANDTHAPPGDITRDHKAPPRASHNLGWPQVGLVCEAPGKPFPPPGAGYRIHYMVVVVSLNL